MKKVFAFITITMIIFLSGVSCSDTVESTMYDKKKELSEKNLLMFFGPFGFPARWNEARWNEAQFSE